MLPYIISENTIESSGLWLHCGGWSSLSFVVTLLIKRRFVLGEQFFSRRKDTPGRRGLGHYGYMS